MKVVTEGWPKALHMLLQRLESSGHEAVLVGGSVRDMLLSRTVHDWDVATSATPQEVMSIFERCIPTGIAHGTVTVLVLDMPFEVTTYRTEGEYSDGRRPDYVRYTRSLTVDLQRRDFTVNAIAALSDGTIADPMNGLLDIAARAVRAVGNPYERISEDALRILRGIRLAAELGFEIEAETHAAMAARCQLLKQIAFERIGAEWARILTANNRDLFKLVAAGPWLCVLPAPWPSAADAFARLDPIRHLGSHARSLTPDQHPVLLPVCLAVAEIAWLAGWDGDALRIAIRTMRWSNQVRLAALDLHRLLTCGMENWSDLDWQSHLLYDGRELVRTACLIQDGTGDPTLTQQYQRECARQPIQSLNELNVTGHDLVRLGAIGSEIGKLKTRLIEGILANTVQNERLDLMHMAASELQRIREETGDGGDQDGTNATGGHSLQDH